MKAILWLYAFLALSPMAWSSPQSDEELKEYLLAFHKNPGEAMKVILPTRDLNGNVVQSESPFPRQAVEDGSYVDAHLHAREKLCSIKNGQRICLKDVLEGKAELTNNDKPEDLVDLPHVMHSVVEMEHAHLLKGQIDGPLPWSDSYWPINQGVVANRYADGSFPHSADWKTNHAFFVSHPPSGGSDVAAPSEKYDFLVGDAAYTLTHNMWARGNRKVASWEGICDGWSAASIMIDEPLRSVYATAANGHQVHLYPSDIKGLASILWSSATPNVRFIGNKCEIGGPARDPVGRIKDPKCWDTNPGAFHMVTVNQIGLAKRAFILDGVYDIEIWNYPTWMYEFSYFNPQTLQPSTHWKDAIIPVDQFYIDKFKPYRSANAKYFIGISMNVTYMVEFMPSHAEGRHLAAPKTVHYIYDLELNDKFEIIGGEWYSFNHPDFVWAPPHGSRAMSIGDSHLVGEPNWNGSDVMPTSYVEVAPLASSQDQPLAMVIEQLARMSK